MKEGVEFNRWGLCHHSCCGSRPGRRNIFCQFQWITKKSLLMVVGHREELARGGAGAKPHWGHTASCRSSHVSGGSRRKKETQRQCLFQSGERHPIPKQRRRARSRSGPIPLCKYTSSDLPASSLPKDLFPSHPLSVFLFLFLFPHKSRRILFQDK